MTPERSVFENLFSGGERIELRKGEILHRSDERCRAMGLVLSGEIRLSRVLSTGKEIFLKDFREGDLFAELIVFTAEYYPGWLIASEPSRVVEVKQADVLEYIGANELLISYLAGISRKMAHLSRSIEILSLKTVRQKIAFSLLNTEENTEKSSGGGIPVNVTRFASEINCSWEAVSRAFSAMEADGLVKRYLGFVVIPDKQRLESLI